MTDIVADALELAGRLSLADAHVIRRLVVENKTLELAWQASTELAKAAVFFRGELAVALAEATRLRGVLDSRPAIDEALPQSYIQWCTGINETEWFRERETHH
jgi:hypothetical protein